MKGRAGFAVALRDFFLSIGHDPLKRPSRSQASVPAMMRAAPSLTRISVTADRDAFAPDGELVVRRGDRGWLDIRTGMIEWESGARTKATISHQ